MTVATEEVDTTSLLGAVTEEVTPEIVTPEVKVEVEKAPDEYTDFTLPEGMALDEDLVKEFKPLAKELGLSQDKAQKLVDLQTKTMEKIGKATQAAWENTLTEWRKASETDAEFGGTALKENIVFAKTAIDKFGNDKLREALDVTGVGNHPEFVRFMVKVGKAVSEDKVRVGNSADTSVYRDPAKLLYPGMN